MNTQPIEKQFLKFVLPSMLTMLLSGLLIAASAVITVILVLLNPTILRALGAEGEVYDAAIAYIHVIAVGGRL